MAKRKAEVDTSHIKWSADGGTTDIWCERCTSRSHIVLPVEVGLFVKQLNGFITAHKHCPIRETKTT